MAKGPGLHVLVYPYLDFALPLTLVVSACASLAGAGRCKR